MYRTSPSSQPTQSSQPPRSSAPAARHIWRTLRLMAGAVCLLGALALAGCGVTITGSDLGGGVTNSNTPLPGTAQPGSSVGVGSGTTVKPCAGNDVAPSKTPTIVLTVKDSHKTTQAHIGDVVEVRLSANMRWTTPADGVASVLTPLQPQGGLDSQGQTCSWVYQVKATGSAALTYIGVFNCEPNSACPAIAEDEEFTIQAA